MTISFEEYKRLGFPSKKPEVSLYRWGNYDVLATSKEEAKKFILSYITKTQQEEPSKNDFIEVIGGLGHVSYHGGAFI